MFLRGQFIASGEEGFALDAFTSDKLAEMGLFEIGRDSETSSRYYMKPGDNSFRLVRTAGFRKDGIVHYGSVVREVQDNDGWHEDAKVSLETFVNERYPFGEAAEPRPDFKVLDFLKNQR